MASASTTCTGTTIAANRSVFLNAVVNFQSPTIVSKLSNVHAPLTWNASMATSTNG